MSSWDLNVKATAGEGGGNSFSSFSVPTNLGSNFHSKVQLQASEICVVSRITFIFPLLLSYLSVCVHREISRLGGEAAALVPSSFSSPSWLPISVVWARAAP